LPRYTKTLVPLILLLALCPTLHASGFADKTVAWLGARGLSPVWIVLLISMIPIIELRGAIPIAILFFKMDAPLAVGISILGNMLPVPVILLLMDRFFALLRKFRWGERFEDWIFKRTRNKGKVVQKYEAIGLTIFVGIPLPGTGAWTGALAANIFGVAFWRSMLCILLGVLIAAAAVTTLVLTGQMVAS
jgi:uncharacterized membrane protein